MWGTESKNLPDILKRLSQDHRFYTALQDNLQTRAEWSYVLDINPSTIWKWETKIISKVSPIQASYIDPKRGLRGNYLDAYQRFIICCIYLYKGCFSRGTRSNSEVIKFLKQNFQTLNRENFEIWRQNNVTSI
jgi:hypothetical protein